MATTGQGQQCYIIPAQTSVGTTPIVSSIVWLKHARIISFVLQAGPGSGGNLDGTWKIELSNDYNGAGQSELGQAPTAGKEKWVDQTAGFKGLDGTATAAVAQGTASSQLQYVQAAPCGARVARVTFTPSAGAGTVMCAVAGGEY